MNILELIELLQKYPKDTEVFRGDYYHKSSDGLEIYGLYDELFEEPKFFEQMRSCRSSLPSSNSIKKNVLVFE